MTPVGDALVLAGERDGAPDPLAAQAGVGCKALVPVAGRPLIAHVLNALMSAGYERALVSAKDPHELLADATVKSLYLSGRLAFTPAKPAILDSVMAAAEQATFPLLVTTADNALLTAAILEAFEAGRQAEYADVAVAFATKAAVLAAHPEGQRRFYAFREAEYSNCNLYWLRRPAALQAARVFRQGGQFAKHPARIVQAFGLVNLALFSARAVTLAQLMRRLSRRFRVTVRRVVLADGSAAIDVDNARTHAIAEALLRRRQAAVVPALELCAANAR